MGQYQRLCTRCDQCNRKQAPQTPTHGASRCYSCRHSISAAPKHRTITSRCSNAATGQTPCGVSSSCCFKLALQTAKTASMTMRRDVACFMHTRSNSARALVYLCPCGTWQRHKCEVLRCVRGSISRASSRWPPRLPRPPFPVRSPSSPTTPCAQTQMRLHPASVAPQMDPASQHCSSYSGTAAALRAMPTSNAVASSGAQPAKTPASLLARSNSRMRLKTGAAGGPQGSRAGTVADQQK